jgi:hypothetical protein
MFSQKASTNTQNQTSVGRQWTERKLTSYIREENPSAWFYKTTTNNMCNFLMVMQWKSNTSTGKQKERPLGFASSFHRFMKVSKPLQKCAISYSTAFNSHWWRWLGLKYKFHNFLQILEFCNNIFYTLLIHIIITFVVWMSNVIKFHTHIFLLQMCTVTMFHFCKVS